MVVTGVGCEENVFIRGFVSSAECCCPYGYRIFVSNEYFVALFAAFGNLPFACTGTAKFIHSLGIYFIKVVNQSFARTFDFYAGGNCFADFASCVGAEQCNGVVIGQPDEEVELFGIYIAAPCTCVSYLPTYVLCAEEVSIGRLDESERRCLVEAAHVGLDVCFGTVWQSYPPTRALAHQEQDASSICIIQRYFANMQGKSFFKALDEIVCPK